MLLPGPAVLGRGVVVNVGGVVPSQWAASDVIVVDESVLADPADTVERLHVAWARRQPVVVELRVDAARFRQPQSIGGEPWMLAADAEPWHDRLHFLTWANTYDARGGEPIWWWGVKAARMDDAAAATPAGPADVTLGDGRAIWVDGGPRQPWAPSDVGGFAVVHSESVDSGRLVTAPVPVDPSADLAADQLVAVAHRSGAARVIAPAGSGKTRVLTERLRHLHRDRGVEPSTIVAVAYNKQAQLEMEARTTDFRPHVRTLNSLGLWVVAEHRGSSPPVVDEREVRRMVEALVPGRRPRRANTDPIGPYVEGLASIRLALRDPEEVESSRDDVPGLAELFPAFRLQLAERGVLDFDEQIYGAVEALLRDGAFRRSMQRSCRHVLVDEFQDLTPSHVLLIRLLALPALDVFGVGDDDQCIYGHAGADPGFLIDYGHLFPAAAEHALNVNYRCPVEVIAGARALLGYNDRRVTKQIEAGPASDPARGALRVEGHAPDDGAVALVAVVRGWLDEPGVDPSTIAVLTRVNSLLLAPHVALHEAGIAIASVLRPDVLERTGIRAALAYLRLAAATGGLHRDDIVEILRRPTRGLPPWFSERLARRDRWTLDQLHAIGGRLSDKDGVKVERLVDDLRLVVDAGRDGTTRDVLETVRDDVGLGTAMNLLDRTGGGQGSSHLDDLEGLLGVADLHPDPAGFEAWLRTAFQREADPAGVTLSTIHRVKGREWDRVAVFGVTDGLVPHRLAEDVEEERRVLHVAITRGRHRVAVLTDHTRPSGFLDELAGTAPRRPARPARVTAPAPVSRTTSTPDGIGAEHGLVVRVAGGYDGTVEEVDGRAAMVRLPSGATLRVRFGERVEHDGKRAALAPPSRLWGGAAEAEASLRAWRTSRATTDGVPAYVVVNDKHLRGIAMARPATPAELATCDGIGPTKLERYGDELLALLEPFLRS